MKSLITMESLRAWRKKLTRKVVFVPTMGALHHGHEALIARARRLAGPKGSVVVSIFLNPIQFGPREDIAAYPKPLKNDLVVCSRAGADAVFLPKVADMYGPDRSVFVDEESLSSVLCGRSRPGHFRGVCTVVAKLFNIVQPTHAIFGEKDWQQLAIIRRLVADLDMDIDIVGFPTQREEDGLALSSRNAYLTPEERIAAVALPRALGNAAKAIEAGQPIDAVLSKVGPALEKAGFASVDYVALVDAVTLQPLLHLDRPARIVAAAQMGKARLIDNLPVTPQN